MRQPADSEDFDPRAERIAYAVAVVGLIGIGVVVRTPILNWIVGPAFVVTVVVVLTPLLSRRRGGRR
jgi:hypothetical protein